MHAQTEDPIARIRRISGHLQWIPRNLSSPANPLRYMHGRLKKALRPREFFARRAAGRQFRANVDPELAGAVESFEKEGVVAVDHLIDRALLEELAAYYEQVVVPRREQLGAVGARPFFSHLRTDDDLNIGGIAARFALQEKILRVVSTYMGKLPFLRNLSFLESNPVPGQTKWEQSQLWHLDYYYTMRTPSLWVYLTDVQAMEQGPFTYLPAAASRKLRNNLVPRHITDEEVEAAGLAGEIRHIKAPRLSAFLVDNPLISHLGSRMAEGHRRAAYIAHYVDPVNEKPWIRQNGPVPERVRLLFNRE
jgi:hypothetical protein